ncbi:MAG: trypsin-like peptidase domain-containing protein, partial [Candidatus Saccharibacteria bacterium]|nr:trypsin-like peptidase domain-containing protein [Candidatus Saccharibacteria bacterium]
NTATNSVVVSTDEQAATKVAREVSPSVVSVTTTSVTNNGYFQTTSKGAGTGVIISKDGYILSNKHVVNGATQVSIVMNDGTVHSDVKLVGVDPLNDLAFLKMTDPPKDLVPAKLANSNTVKVGQKVLAIGNALGEFKNSVTSGIISGKGRPITAQDGSMSGESLENLLQTDAAINPGNSGGPLVNLSGQVIGINTAVAADSQGIGFAIPINAAKGLIKGLIANGKVERAYLGVAYVTLNPEIATRFNLPASQGAYVYDADGNSIIANSPAAKAGVQNKDVILSVNGTKIDQNNGLSLLLAGYAPGDKVTLNILRDGQKKNIDVTLEAYTAQ